MAAKSPSDKANPGPKTRKSRNNVSEESQKVSENVEKHPESVKYDRRHDNPGRPTIFTQELADKICERIANGDSLRKISRDEDMPPAGTVLRWVAHDLIFREQYEAAMEQRAEYLFEEMFEIADETNLDTIETETGERPNAEWISRSRLRVDVRKWALSKMMPKKYGDKLQVGGAEDLPPLNKMSDADLEKKIAERLAALKGK